jgi:hypothetical protein
MAVAVRPATDQIEEPMMDENGRPRREGWHRRQEYWDTFTFVTWRVVRVFGFAGLLTYFGFPIVGLWWIGGNALIYALLALDGILYLEKRFPETD